VNIVKDLISIDITVALGLAACFICAAISVREMTGPFNRVVLVEIVVFIQQELNYAFLASVLSLQVILYCRSTVKHEVTTVRSLIESLCADLEMITITERLN
jgi:hypothetical protein